MVTTLTYRELLGRVALVAGMLAARGVGKGDRVVIYMPMVPEAVRSGGCVGAAAGPLTRSIGADPVFEAVGAGGLAVA
jgi:acyl-coenzyme A synthetase/AMP-(fatty) acid ligase